VLDELQGNAHAHTGSPHGTLLHKMYCCMNLLRDKYRYMYPFAWHILLSVPFPMTVAAMCDLLHDGLRYVYPSASQILLSVQVVDGELEEDNAHVSRASLTQHFPFEACPPTTKQASHSPCLQRLVNAVEASKDGMTVAERNSLIKVCHGNITLFATDYACSVSGTCEYAAYYTAWPLRSGINGGRSGWALCIS